MGGESLTGVRGALRPG